MTGKIISISRDGAYAIARSTQHHRVFLHLSEFLDFNGTESCSWSVLTLGASVNFEIVDSPRGPRGKRIWLDNAPTTIPGKLGGPVVKLSSKGYGFFLSAGGGRVFFAASETPCFDSLSLGDHVVADHLEPSGAKLVRAVGVRPDEYDAA